MRAWLTAVASVVLLVAHPPGQAQESTTIPEWIVDEAQRVRCGGFATAASSTSPGGLAAETARNDKHNASVRQCIRKYYMQVQSRQRQDEAWRAIPVGEDAGGQINGQVVRKCSHGGSCFGSSNIASTPTPAPRPSTPRPEALPRVSGPASLVSVEDGDTIRVTTSGGQKVTIRMACIDAPETAQAQSGAEATNMLKWLLANHPLEIRPQTTNRYGHTVAEVYANGRNVNLEMVRIGTAYAYRHYLRGCDANAYLDAESQAERSRQGVWRWGNEMKPWDFRKQQR